jgi:hypothetical protein
MACAINGNTVRNGMTSFVEKQLTDSNVFDRQGRYFVPKTNQSYAARVVVQDINKKFSENVIDRGPGARYSVSIPDSLVLQYVRSSEEGAELSTNSGMFFDLAYTPESWNKDSTFTSLNYPEISQFTYDNLVSFLKSINPKFQVEEVDNLSTSGVTSLKDFLIAVKTMSKFRALPEEVAHVLVTLLPDDHALKTQAIDNITSFQIYADVLEQYKNVYTLPDGRPDYQKIKEEAVAKLVGEYVTAISTDNFSRIQELTKPRQGWLERWFWGFVKWLGINILDKTTFYSDLAAMILTGETDTSLKNEQQIEDMSFTDTYFYRLSEEQQYDNAIALAQAMPPGLLETISKFSKEFGKRFNEILKEEKFAELNEMLKRSGTDVGKINRLSEIKILLGEAGIDLRAALDTEAFVTGLKQFLEAVDRLDILSDSILAVIKSKEKSKTFDQAIKNIKELEGYFSIYETFNNVISADLAQVLVDANVATDVIESIQRSQEGFRSVNREILTRLRNDLFIFYKTMLEQSNNVASQALAEDMERNKDNPKALEFFKERLDKLITTDQDIIAMLSGKGRDIDNYSSLNHLVNAAAANGDVYLSSIAKYIQNKIEGQQVKAAVSVRTLYQNIDAIQKALNEDAVETGTKVSFLDLVYDPETGENRQVLTWLNPFRNIQPALDMHRRAVSEAAQKRAETDRNSSEFDEADNAFKEAQRNYYDFLEKYYHRPFVREYYDFKKKYEVDTDFISVMRKWQQLSEEIRAYELALGYDAQDETAWNNLSISRRERANLLSDFDLNGMPKAESELKEVKILKQYFEEQAKFREDDAVQTERSFLIAQNRYEQKVDFAIRATEQKKPKDMDELEASLQELLKDSRIRVEALYGELEGDPDQFDYPLIKEIIMTKWKSKNIVIERNDAFFKYEQELYEKLKALRDAGSLSEVEEELTQIYADIRNILFGTRDDIMAINPDSLTDEQKFKIIAFEERIEELREQRPRATVDPADMSEEDRNRYEDLSLILKSNTISARDKISALRERSSIAKRYKNTGKAKAVNELIKELASIKRRIPTHYYWDKLITFIPSMAEFGRHAFSLNLKPEEETEMTDFILEFMDTVDTEDHEKLDFSVYDKALFDEFLNWLRKNRPDQHQWFIDNHFEKTVFDGGRKTTIKYGRSNIYNRVEPTRKEHEKEVYNRRFRKYKVKNEYRTGYNPTTGEVELQVGVHITNREYNGFPEFLPLLPEQGAPADSPYRNEAYYNLRDNDPLRFQYLTLLRDADLKEQEKLPSRLRRWNQVPIMVLSNIEELQPSNLKHVAEQKWDYVKSIFKKDTKLAATDADAEEAAKGEDTAREIDQFTQTTIQERIPKLGMSQKVPIERVSRDLLKSTAQFIIRSHEFEGRTEAEPVVKALIRVMEDNEYKNQMSNKERAKKFESIFSQMILQEIPETTLNSKAVRRIAKFLTTNTGLRMLADPIGGIINYSSAMVNNIIEASAGRHLNFAELAKGKYLAGRAMTSFFADFNKKANLSVDTLMFQTFDMIQGEFEEDLLDRSSSRDKKASIRQLMMIPRKNGELLAQMSIAFGILERHKVLNSIDNRLYPVHEIYEKDETGNNLKLKAGFPEEYNPIDGAKFLKIKRLINIVNHGLHGNYAKLTQTEASRYAIGKLAENMKRWFMPAFQRRFGRETIDINFEDDPLNEGYYRTGARAARNIFGAMFRLDFGGAKGWLDMFLNTPRYKQNLARLGAEIAQAFLLFMTFSLLLGYAGDDKNKQLENNSWIHNTAILILLRVYSETTAYTPFPQVGPFFGGFQEMKRNVLTPFSLPADAVSNFAAIAQLGLYQVLYWFGADGLQGQLYYSKDAGYWYSEKGDSKLLKYVLNSLGHTGYTLQPEQYIKQFDNLQKRLK